MPEKQIKHMNEVLEIPIKLTRVIDEKKVIELNNLFNQRIAEGWKLVAHSYVGNQGGSTNVMFITFETGNKPTTIVEYKSEIVEISTKLAKSNINEKELSNLNKLINQRIIEGWKFVTHTFLSAGGMQTDVMLITFKKEQ